MNGYDPVNQISDFVTVANYREEGEPNSLRLLKVFNGLTDAEILQNLQGIEIEITDPLGYKYTYKLTDMLNPNGIVLGSENDPIHSGVYVIDEKNSNIPGYNLQTTPPMPIITYLVPNPLGEILIRIDNIYSKPPVPSVPNTPAPDTPGFSRGSGGNAGTGDYSNMLIWQIALLASALGLISILMWRWRDKRGFAKK